LANAGAHAVNLNGAPFPLPLSAEEDYTPSGPLKGGVAPPMTAPGSSKVGFRRFQKAVSVSGRFSRGASAFSSEMAMGRRPILIYEKTCEAPLRDGPVLQSCHFAVSPTQVRSTRASPADSRNACVVDFGLCGSPRPPFDGIFALTARQVPRHDRGTAKPCRRGRRFALQGRCQAPGRRATASTR
jgi:hypothetical protein